MSARRRAASALVGLLGITTGSCELTSVEVTPPGDLVVAEVVLDAGASTQRAILYPGLGEGEGGTPTRLDGGEALPPATLIVRAADRDASLEYAPAEVFECIGSAPVMPPPGARCYAAEDGADPVVRPAQRYDLEVRLADGRTLAGQTRVPGAFDVVRPAGRRCALRQRAIPLTWTRSDGAASYQIDVFLTGLREGLLERGVQDPPDQLELLGVAIGAADTTVVFPDEIGVFDRFDIDRDILLALRDGLPAGARADVVISAGDANFVNWVRGGTFNPSGQVRVSSLTGNGIVSRRLELHGPEADLPACE